MSSVGYKTSPQFRLKTQNPADWVVIGTERTKLDGTTEEKIYRYGVDSEIVKETTEVGEPESYLFTCPPVLEGYWQIYARTNYGVVADDCEFDVELPENSKLVEFTGE